ncbi:MAG TPA: hypothetical protein VLA58_09085, partial [Chitinophagaceae bacterium]|nr:hypothetical protein [Chitinophagaceae bacterium]
MKSAFSLLMLITTIFTTVQGQTGIFSTSNIYTDTASYKTPTGSKLRFISSASRYIRVGYEGGYILPVDDKEEVNNLFRESRYRTITVTSSWDV